MIHHETFTPRHHRFLRQARFEPTCFVDVVFLQYIDDLADEGAVRFRPSRWKGSLEVRPAPWMDPGWGEPYIDDIAYENTEFGPVRMFRNGQRVRFYTIGGRQVGSEQRNVAPATAYAAYVGWRAPRKPVGLRWFPR